jgi:hypothetical protein
MELTYSEKLQRIRTGVEVVKLAEAKLQGEVEQVLRIGDTVWFRCGERTFRGLVAETARLGPFIRVMISDEWPLLLVLLSDLVEAPTP